MTVFKLIATDYAKYRKYGSNFFVILFLTQGFWATFQYRIAHYAYVKIRLQPFRILFKIVMLFWQKAIEILTGISIPASAQIGHSLYIGHFGNIIITSGAVIGNNCNLSQGVTIGISGRGDKRGEPVLGSNVYIGTNAVIAGKISIGNNALISANSLVIEDVPENACVLGVPAKIINHKGSEGYI